MAILSVQQLKKSYRKGFIPQKHEVLKGLDFRLEPGSITGFLGGNGAGKTTTMKCILGLAFPDSGEITYFDGQELTSDVKRRIGFLPERPYFYDYLTGQEFLEFYGELSGGLTRKAMRSRIDELLKKVDLDWARDRKLREYSKGMLQKVGMAQALIHDPEFVILDEPMAGLDPDGRMYLADIIREVASAGRAVFFSSHLLHDAERLCKDLVVLRDGVVIYEGGTEELLAKMSATSIITYSKGGERQAKKSLGPEALQKDLGQLLSEGATILGVKQDTNLEEAFTKIGLRGGEQ